MAAASGRRSLIPALLMVLAVVGTGCDNIHTPWKQGVWQQERSRSAEAAQELDHRIKHTQIDR